ncbi:CLUMA_CG021112, isoform A [Clunio marinus]|uniref:CLUMA_CG021112, isoform A n=1 Tax=Clunio marinus TaxID=568069 RepID=A0A1J1J834_9DIPT|nr:CLUMA_CG021112, isoform A [Clunio marinus]
MSFYCKYVEGIFHFVCALIKSVRRLSEESFNNLEMDDVVCDACCWIEVVKDGKIDVAAWLLNCV